jgi:hypothetical protein
MRVVSTSTPWENELWRVSFNVTCSGTSYNLTGPNDLYVYVGEFDGGHNGNFWDSLTGTAAIYDGTDPNLTYNMSDLNLTIKNPSAGQVQLNPAPYDPNFPQYADGTPVELTAVPEPNKGFKWWKIYDPNHPGDGNHVVKDTNTQTTIIMNADYDVTAVFTCSSGSSEVLLLLPLMLAMLAILAAARRLR